MSYGTVQAEKMTTESGYTLGAGNASSFKNRVINGGMDIDQRNAGVSVTPASSVNTYTLDRWAAFVTQSSKLTVQQNAGSVTPPAGFTNYLGVTSSSAYSVVASDLFLINQQIEAFNVSDFNLGRASAVTFTLSFWVRSSLTGTFSGSVSNSAQNRSYVFTYTINAANTWEQKSITIPGDTTGTWATGTGRGLSVNWSLGVGSSFSGTAGSWQSSALFASTGSTSVVGTNGATWQMTGVQLEVGTVATSFDFRSIGTELALCQRYFSGITGNIFGSGITTGASSGVAIVPLPVYMRTSPTITTTGTLAFRYGSADFSASAFSGALVPQGVYVYFASSGMANGNTGTLWSSTVPGSISFSAEL
jgi:hypothetical protein